MRGCALRSDWRRAAFVGLAIGGVTACEIEKVEIPRPDKSLALHGVLSASAPSQVVLLERTRNGSVAVYAPSFDLESPLGSDSGIAESGAQMTLTAPDGKVFAAIEDSRVNIDRSGRGVYRFYVGGSALVRGAPYRLRVVVSNGVELTAETSLPAGTVKTAPDTGAFNRAKDTLQVAWSAAAGARSYFVRIETPYGPRSFFTDSTHIRFTGDLRNIELDALPRVFIPGFPQTITVSAVDSNYYDWFRTHNASVSGQGLISRVNGGLGVFGSLVRLTLKDIEVTAPQPEPAAGHFDFSGSAEEGLSNSYPWIELYVESVSARRDQGDALTGRYARTDLFARPGCPICGVLGTVKDGHVELAFLAAWSARDTVEYFTGDLHGDTLVGSYRRAGGRVRFTRRR